MVREIKVMERRRRRSIIIDHLFGRRARAVFAGHALARSDGSGEKKGKYRQNIVPHCTHWYVMVLYYDVIEIEIKLKIVLNDAFVFGYVP